jgi:hypothetical protein
MSAEAIGVHGRPRIHVGASVDQPAHDVDVDVLGGQVEQRAARDRRGVQTFSRPETYHGGEGLNSLTGVAPTP